MKKVLVESHEAYQYELWNWAADPSFIFGTDSYDEMCQYIQAHGIIPRATDDQCYEIIDLEMSFSSTNKDGYGFSWNVNNFCDRAFHNRFRVKYGLKEI